MSAIRHRYMTLPLVPCATRMLPSSLDSLLPHLLLILSSRALASASVVVSLGQGCQHRLGARR